MLPEEITNYIGKEIGVRTFEAEKGAIKRFADAVDDQNPLYYDEEYAQKSRHGSIIAPPGFISALWFTRPVTKYEREHEPAGNIRDEALAQLTNAGYTRLLDGGMEYDFLEPVRAGDTITATSAIKDIFEREGKTGKMAFVITETTYTDQNGKIVARARQTLIKR